MALPNDNAFSAIRKASRPLSIIDENPDDHKGHVRSLSENTSIKRLSQDASRLNESPRSGILPTRRKAVAPLQHPVDLLLTSEEKIDQQKAVKNAYGISGQSGIRGDNHYAISGDTMRSYSNEMVPSDMNGNGHKSVRGTGNRFVLNNEDTTLFGDQFSHIKNIGLEPFGKLNSKEETDERYVKSCNFINRYISCTSKGIGNVDENGNENNTCCNEHQEFAKTISLNSHSLSHSIRSLASSEKISSSGIFYLSNSTNSLNEDVIDDVEKTDERNNKSDAEPSLPNTTSHWSARDGDVDVEQIEWKNKVKKSRSFIKTCNSHRPMGRSISATFSENPGIRENPDDEKCSYSPGSLRRSHSLQIDSLRKGDESNQLKSFFSIVRKDQELDISTSSLHQNRESPKIQIRDASFSRANTNAADKSNGGPIRRISAIDQSDFSLLKVTANRLHLKTRRPSVMAWKEKYMQSSLPKYFLQEQTDQTSPVHGNTEWTDDSVNRINSSLSLLRKELIDIRLQDQSLARQFLGLRNTMNSLRLTLQCKDHKELLDEAVEDIEELRELSQLVDLPPELLSPVTSLQNLGITRMNISSRRFSTC